MSMDLAEKKRQRPRQGSLLRPRPIGRDRVVFSRGRACRCYALACGRGAHGFARPLARPLRSGCMRNLLFGKLHALAGAAIGGFGVQIGRAFAKPLADNEAVLLENRTTVVSVTGRPDGYRADLLPHNLKVIGSNPIPATTFVITHSPSRSNRRDGFGFSEERRGRATEQVRLRASVTGSIENDRRAFAVDRAFRDATRALIQLKSGDGRSRSTRKLPLSVFAIKSGAGVRIFSGAPLAPMTYFMQAVLI
jgi:hypothetical protein